MTDPAQNATGGAAISTRDSVTFGFGLEQVDATTRTELLRRSLNYLVPTAADTTPPTIVGYKFPPANSVATPRDPVEVDVTAYDNSGDMDYVRLLANGQPVETTQVFPFQFRYTPPASAVGSTVRLTAEAVDAAGNISRRDHFVNVVDADVAGPVAGAGGTADAVRHADRRRDDDVHQRRVPQPAALVLVRVAAQRRRDRGRHGGELHADERRPRAHDRVPDLRHQHGGHR